MAEIIRVGGGIDQPVFEYVKGTNTQSPLNSTVTLDEDIEEALILLYGNGNNANNGNIYHITVTTSEGKQIGNKLSWVYSGWGVSGGCQLMLYKGLKKGDRIKFAMDSASGFGRIIKIR